MKKIVYLVLISLILSCVGLAIFNPGFFAYAQEEEEVYLILNEDSIYINSSYDVQVGDMFIAEDNVLYEIFEVCDESLTAYARPKKTVQLPEVEQNPNEIIPISSYEKRIAMYHTHNDESYVIGDGYDSIYGEGGVVDIGDAFASELKKHNIKVYKDDTLHLPHDSKAYVRSKLTAQNLINSVEPDAIFDIHRDGVSRKQFLGEINGKEGSKIRIVIGKSNPNNAVNLELAMAIKAYADAKYPGLIKDIYIGSGNYNQNLSKNALLFEMGTYLIEKDYVMSSLPYLADTIDKVMYTTAVEMPSEENYGESILEEDSNSSVKLESSASKGVNDTTKWVMVGVFISIIVGSGIILVVRSLKILKKKRKKKT